MTKTLYLVRHAQASESVSPDLYRPLVPNGMIDAARMGKHLASKMQGVAKLELTKCLPNPDGTAASYYRMAALYFESLETMQQTFASPEGQDAVADLSKFATGGVKMVVGIVES